MNFSLSRPNGRKWKRWNLTEFLTGSKAVKRQTRRDENWEKKVGLKAGMLK